MHPGFTAEQWQHARETYLAWWNRELDRPLISIFKNSDPAMDGKHLLPNVPEETSDEELVAFVERRLAQRRHFGDAIPFYFINAGPGVAAAFAGSELVPAETTAWFKPLPVENIAGLRVRFDPESRWWKRIRHVTELLATRLGDRIQIAFPDLGGNLDILASLRSTDALLLDMAVQPGEVRRCVDEVTALWWTAYEELYELIGPRCPGTMGWYKTWAPGRTYMLQSDISAMISPDMFEQFVAPDIDTCCKRLEYPFYHLDGPDAIEHLDSLLRIETLRGIQWVSGAGNPEAAEWPDVLGRIREAGKLCQVGATPDGARRILREHGGKGFMFTMNAGGMSESEIAELVRRIGADS